MVACIEAEPAPYAIFQARCASVVVAFPFFSAQKRIECHDKRMFFSFFTLVL
jgi:hypothetical protein